MSDQHSVQLNRRYKMYSDDILIAHRYIIMVSPYGVRVTGPTRPYT